MTAMGTSFYGYAFAPPWYTQADYVEEWDGAEWRHETAPKWLPSCQYRFRADHAFYTPPAEWALDAAVKRSIPGLETWARFGLEYGPQTHVWLTVVELARMIERHEQEPVDPLYLFAREVISLFLDRIGQGHNAVYVREGVYDAHLPTALLCSRVALKND